MVLGTGVGGCGTGAELEPLPDELGVLHAEKKLRNGLSTNGLSTNGLSTNGLSTNGLSTNGLSTNGFSVWFNQNLATAEDLMRYMVRCAVPQGQTRTFTNPVTGLTYTWQGGLGLAPDWAAGQPATELEQEVISACLAAHANKYGIHISISVLGRNAQGTPIPYDDTELTTYREKEACFFGNLFDGSGLFAASDQELSSHESTARACGLSSGTSDCPPIVHVGACGTVCERSYSGYDSRPYYSRCTHNGKTYRPLTTRIRPQEIYKCGDGVCQFTEHCGTGSSAKSCQADCGTCP